MAPGIFPFYVVPNFCENRGHMQANFCFCVSQSVSQFCGMESPRRSFERRGLFQSFPSWLYSALPWSSPTSSRRAAFLSAADISLLSLL